jgi:hypothetical protein
MIRVDSSVQVLPANCNNGRPLFTEERLCDILIQDDLARSNGSSLFFVWIDTHALSNTAFNISPFFASAVNASPNAHYTFFFSLPEIVYQTHFISY